MIRKTVLLLVALVVGAGAGLLSAAALAFVGSGVFTADGHARGHLGWVRLIFALGLEGGGPVLPVLGAVAAGFLMVRRLNRPRPQGFCPCGYDLTGNMSGVCPECGTAVGGGVPPALE